ncbi:tetratricopeptide repeat protein [Kushneria aurantia]|uniref:Tetratricopeptide repeat protein n=1 Tax=Kushneria aurantia TaxID=504092 RepID=A0ABV6G5I7_9GAMM|nr:tetratricopeptide repeat protein [Kushneria aurantia]
MLRSTQLFTRLEYRLAARLMRVPWLSDSSRKRRLTLHLFRRCARAGHVEALSVYGAMLFRCGHTARDRAVGARCVVQAAEAGDRDAQYQVARMYEHGCTQFARRDDRAVTWYARAAEGGHDGAGQRLAYAFERGELGLPIDLERSRRWHRPANGENHLMGTPAVLLPDDGQSTLTH